MATDSLERREFMKGTAWMGAVVLAAGSASGASVDRVASGTSYATMAGFAAPPMERIRLAFIGIGDRGSAAVRRVCRIPGCEIVALCDLRKEAVDKNEKWLKENTGSRVSSSVEVADVPVRRKENHGT